MRETKNKNMFMIADSYNDNDAKMITTMIVVMMMINTKAVMKIR